MKIFRFGLKNRLKIFIDRPMITLKLYAVQFFYLKIIKIENEISPLRNCNCGYMQRQRFLVGLFGD